jgi:hypothetical protein
MDQRIEKGPAIPLGKAEAIMLGNNAMGADRQVPSRGGRLACGGMVAQGYLFNVFTTHTLSKSKTGGHK